MKSPSPRSSMGGRAALATFTPLLNQARDTVWPKFFDQIEHLEPDTVLDAIEHALDRGEFFVFPGKGTRLGWRLRRWLPNLIWRRIHAAEGTP